MLTLSRAVSALAFARDLARAAVLGARERCFPTPPVDPRSADEVQFLIEGDPARGLSPAARYRALQYVPLLEARGFRCVVRPSRPAKYFSAAQSFQDAYARWPRLAMAYAHVQHLRQARNRRADFRALAGRGVVFLQRDLLALPHSLLERELPLFNRHVVFDFDDAIFVRPPWVPGDSGDGVDHALRGKLASICALSTAVIAANEHLAAFARQHNGNVHVLPTTLCTQEFAPPKEPARNARPVVGWAGTSGNLWYLRQLAPALQALAQRCDYVLRIVCNRVDDAQLAGLPRERLEFVEWRADGEVARLQQFDVGIMPLRPDGWAEGKAGFKMVQYMACGVPFVASPVGANLSTGGPDGECGRYAGNDAEWVDRLATLLADPDLRATLGARGRARAVQHFDRRAHVDALAAILREAARA